MDDNQNIVEMHQINLSQFKTLDFFSSEIGIFE